MPLLVPTDELRSGMKLFEPVMSNAQILMQNGRPLTDRDIDILQKRFPGLRVRVEDPVLDRVIEFEDDSRDREVALEAQRRVSACLADVDRRFSSRASLQDVDFDRLEAGVREIIGHLQQNPVSAALIVQCMDSSTYLGTHTGNVFYLSMLLGSAAMHLIVAERKKAAWARDVQRDFAQDLTPLGLGVLVMDIGLIPHQALLRKKEPLTADEYDLIRLHPWTGAELLPEGFSGVGRLLVRSHHENIAGAGYPKELTADRLHVFARIVRIADAFDAATSEGVFVGAKSPARALWEMSTGPYCGCYDPELMKIFCKLIQPFPIGAKLRLADGRYAAVVRYNRRHPFDPTVVIAFDAENRPLPEDQLDGPFELSSRRELRIASLYGEDLSFIHLMPDEYKVTPSEEAMPLDLFFP